MGIFRVRTYDVAFTGSTALVTLQSPLLPNYIAFVAGGCAGGTTRGANLNAVRVSADPFGSGGLNTTAGASQIELTRTGSGTNWVGTVTLLECTAPTDPNGFRLLDVPVVTLPAAAGIASAIATVNPWGDLSKVGCYGGFRGGGAAISNGSSGSSALCIARFVPSGANTLTVEQNSTGKATSTAVHTCYVVEWGAAWQIQRVTVSGNAGGNGANAVGEFNTAAIAPVESARSFVWGAGHTADGGIGDGQAATLVTLGNGLTVGATESVVAVGQEYSDARVFDVTTHTHPDLSVAHISKSTDGNNGSLTFTYPVPLPVTTESYLTGTAPVTSVTEGERLGFQYNTSNGTGNAYPRPFWSVRHTAADVLTVERQYAGQNWVARIQSVDFGNIVASDATPPALAIALRGA